MAKNDEEEEDIDELWNLSNTILALLRERLHSQESWEKGIIDVENSD